jgi:prepilin-type N-terminal cleavage/methylation domain-containing protein
MHGRTGPDRCVGMCGRAFTIIEMLVVLVIIGILAGIVITVAQRVTQGGKYTTSRNVIQIAEGLLTEYIAGTEEVPPQFVVTRRTQVSTTGTDNVLSPDAYVFPIIDGRLQGRQMPPSTGNGGSVMYDRDRDPAQPSGALLMLALTQESSAVEREFKAIDARFVQLRDVYAYGWLIDANGQPTGAPVQRRLRLPVLVDAFGNMIRYVHSGFQGGYGDFYNNSEPSTRTGRNYLKVVLSREAGQPIIANFGRSYRPFPTNTPNTPVGDADEGQAVGSSGYFYSPGLDGDPGTRQDNVYTKQPTFPTETGRMN